MAGYRHWRRQVRAGKKLNNNKPERRTRRGQIHKQDYCGPCATGGLSNAATKQMERERIQWWADSNVEIPANRIHRLHVVCEASAAPKRFANRGQQDMSSMENNPVRAYKIVADSRSHDATRRKSCRRRDMERKRARDAKYR